VNVSPDLPAQIESFPALQPRSKRESRIAAIFLSNADIDHTLGLLLLRQQEQPVIVYATAATRNELGWIDDLLGSFCTINWCDPPAEVAQLAVSFVDLGRSVAWSFRDVNTGKSLLIAPAVHEISHELQEVIPHRDAILFDGTFWSNDELRPFRANARNAREMGHVPIEQSLATLRNARAGYKSYIHINNTNPILQSQSPERKQLDVAGIGVSFDGIEFEV